jgi:hypothetical protein
MAAAQQPETDVLKFLQDVPGIRALHSSINLGIIPCLERFANGKDNLIAGPAVPRGLEAILVTHGYLEATEEFNPEQPGIYGIRITTEGKSLLEELRQTTEYQTFYGPRT